MNILNLTRLQHALVKLENELAPVIRVESQQMQKAGELSDAESKVLEKLEKADNDAS